MKVCGLTSQRVRPGAASLLATTDSNCGAFLQDRPCFDAYASSTVQPRLWRDSSYSRPGLPRPATSEMDMTQRTAGEGVAGCEGYFLAGAAGLAPAAGAPGLAPATGAPGLPPAAGAPGLPPAAGAPGLAPATGAPGLPPAAGA